MHPLKGRDLVLAKRKKVQEIKLRQSMRYSTVACFGGLIELNLTFASSIEGISLIKQYHVLPMHDILDTNIANTSLLSKYQLSNPPYGFERDS